MLCPRTKFSSSPLLLLLLFLFARLANSVAEWRTNKFLCACTNLFNFEPCPYTLQDRYFVVVVFSPINNSPSLGLPLRFVDIFPCPNTRRSSSSSFLWAIIRPLLNYLRLVMVASLTYLFNADSLPFNYPRRRSIRDERTPIHSSWPRIRLHFAVVCWSSKGTRRRLPWSVKNCCGGHIMNSTPIPFRSKAQAVEVEKGEQREDGEEVVVGGARTSPSNLSVDGNVN